MKSALIDFHSLATIWAPQLTDGVRAFLWRQFPLFFRQEIPDPPPHPDIILQPMGDLPLITDTNTRISALYGFSIFDYRGEFAVGLLHKRLPDILITLSDPLKIIYRPRPGNQGRLYGVLLFGIQLCLKRKNALLSHGAVVEKNGQTLLIAGHRGSGKTQLLLTLLRRGWNYLSDDKFILHRGTAYLFESRIYINDHLFFWYSVRMPESSNNCCRGNPPMSPSSTIMTSWGRRVCIRMERNALFNSPSRL